MDKFAFIIHPIYVSDILKKFPFLSKCPEHVLEGIFRRFPPFKVSHITDVSSSHNQAEGWFVGCPLSSRQIIELPDEYVVNKIIKSGKLAEKLGAKVVGLGALTSVVGDAGITIAKNLNIPVTTGNSYTVAMSLKGLQKASQLMGYDYRKSNIVVVGATGAIGRVVSRKLAKDCRLLTLVGRDINALDNLAAKIYQESGLAVKISTKVTPNIRTADLVVTVTGATDTVINGDELKSGAIVCDVARPRDVSWRVAKMRNDVLVLEGGVVEIPGNVNFNFDFGFPPKTAYACMAETMILALEQRYESFSLGRDLTIEKVEEIERLGTKHGFRLAGFRSFETAIDMDTIETIKQNVKRAKAFT